MYFDAINKSLIPWYVIPVNQRWYRDYMIAQIIVKQLEALKPEWPTLKTKHG